MLRDVSVAVLMPAYDEAVTLTRTLASLASVAASTGGVTVFLVDDGSRLPVQMTSLPEPTPTFTVILARHPINLGQGAALETARRLALREPAFSAYVTMDADGQHQACDAMALAQAVIGGADVVFGDRSRGDSNVPPFRAVLLFFAGIFERVLTGLPLSDAHNGLRAFSRRGLEAISIRQNRMAHATEIKRLVSEARFLSVVELPVSVRYSRETLSKGQRGSGAADILRDLALQYLFGESR
jgi:glycosyltransferase involved in cell wall biosynthesis